MLEPQPPLDDSAPRRAAILMAAMEVFARYGFRRTSMEDIAGAAGLSRSALYLHYRNKPDIFRSLVQTYMGSVRDGVRAALQPGRAPEAALADLFAAKLGPELQALFDSPHGAELLDANHAIAADLVAEGEAAVADALARWLTDEAAAGRIVLPGGDAQTIAAAIVNAIHGQKKPGSRYAEVRAALAQLAQVLGRGLRV